MAARYNDYNWILPNKLAQGAFPDAHPGLFHAFDVVVYCAKEDQVPGFRAPPGKSVLRIPLDDDIYKPIPRPVEPYLHQLALQLCRHLNAGQKALVTCIQGKNRSGLIVGLTLLKLYPGWTAQQVITLIRRNRKLGGGEEALANPMYEQYLRMQR